MDRKKCENYHENLCFPKQFEHLLFRKNSSPSTKKNSVTVKNICFCFRTWIKNIFVQPQSTYCCLPPLCLSRKAKPQSTHKWKWPISGVHSIMMGKSALAGEGGGPRPSTFNLFTITYKITMYAPVEKADRYTPSLSFPQKWPLV